MRNTRVAVAAALGVVATVAVTTGAIGMSVTAGWITHLQIVPLILSAGVPWLAAWVVITFVFGRVYCSSVCPLGTLMDCFSRVGAYTRKGRRYHYNRPMWAVRMFFLMMAVIAITGLSVTLTLILDPYTTFAKIISGVAIPFFTLGALKVSLAVALSAFTAFLIVLFFSLFWGRRLCNTLCPVGTGLGLISIQPVFRIDINTDRCIGCNRCVEVCKASCIDPWSHTVDTTRCVVCFNCTAVCGNKAITYTCNRHKLQHPMLMGPRQS